MVDSQKLFLYIATVISNMVDKVSEDIPAKIAESLA
jgi:hypothetical protein